MSTIHSGNNKHSNATRLQIDFFMYKTEMLTIMLFWQLRTKGKHKPTSTSKCVAAQTAREKIQLRRIRFLARSCLVEMNVAH